jgi:hypothetical protein
MLFGIVHAGVLQNTYGTIFLGANQTPVSPVH